jgi:ubiquinone/menaquinone biosynthesis C-methylase UbiE
VNRQGLKLLPEVQSTQRRQRHTGALDQRRAVQEFFDERSADWADHYDQPARTLSQLDLTARLAVAGRMLSGACEEVPGQASVLEVGCGTGEGACEALNCGASVVATDLSEAMVRETIRRHAKVRGCAADGEALPFANESFDVVQALGVLEYIDQWEHAASDFRRVLKRGGTLILSIPNRASMFRRLHRLERTLTGPLRRMRTRMRGDGTGDPGPSQGFNHRSWTLAEAASLLKDHAFEVVDVRLFTYGFRLPAAEHWAPNLALCRWMNTHCSATGSFARNLACTAVLRARAA